MGHNKMPETILKHSENEFKNHNLKGFFFLPPQLQYLY